MKGSPPPGVRLVEPSRLRPRFHYELLVCELAGHELIGTDARELSPDDTFPPPRGEIDLPLRGKIVLRLIAINRAVHFLVLGAIATIIFVFASHRDALRLRVLADLQTGTSSGRPSGHGLAHEIQHAFSLQSSTLHLVGAVLAGYAIVEGGRPLVPAPLGGYLLIAKRLFGLRGGRAAEQRERDADVGWPALERSAPEFVSHAGGGPSASRDG